jgi:hypothetical protein
MSAIATFPTALDAILDRAPDGNDRRAAQVIGVAIEDRGGKAATDGLMFLIVDHDGHGQLVPAAHVTFTDDKVMPPKYG